MFRGRWPYGPLMTEFLQECYVAASRSDICRRTREQLAAIAADASVSARGVRLLGSVLVPADETLFLLWQADDEYAVRDIVERAGIACERLTEVVAFTSACPEPA